MNEIHSKHATGGGQGSGDSPLLALPMGSGKRNGNRSRSARQCFVLDPTLVCAHVDPIGSLLHEVHIHPILHKAGTVTYRSPFAQNIHSVQVIYEKHNVR